MLGVFSCQVGLGIWWSLSCAVVNTESRVHIWVVNSKRSCSPVASAVQLSGVTLYQRITVFTLHVT